MLLICNKKTERKNDKDQLILGQKYVLHNNYSGQKQGGNFISLPSQKKLRIHSVHCEPAICQNLDKMDS